MYGGNCIQVSARKTAMEKYHSRTFALQHLSRVWSIPLCREGTAVMQSHQRKNYQHNHLIFYFAKRHGNIPDAGHL